MHCRRLTRQTNAFSKKLENFEAAVILSFAYHKIYKMHAAIQTARRWPLARKIASGALRSLSNRWRMENTSKSRRTWFLTFTPANQHGLKPRHGFPDNGGQSGNCGGSKGEEMKPSETVRMLALGAALLVCSFAALALLACVMSVILSLSTDDSGGPMTVPWWFVAVGSGAVGLVAGMFGFILMAISKSLEKKSDSHSHGNSN
jgi:hypothetical protein